MDDYGRKPEGITLSRKETICKAHLVIRLDPDECKEDEDDDDTPAPPKPIKEKETTTKKCKKKGTSVEGKLEKKGEKKKPKESKSAASTWDNLTTI